MQTMQDKICSLSQRSCSIKLAWLGVHHVDMCRKKNNEVAALLVGGQFSPTLFYYLLFRNRLFVQERSKSSSTLSVVLRALEKKISPANKNIGSGFQPRVGSRSAQSRPRVGPRSAQSRPRVGPKSPKVGPKSVQRRPKIRQS